MRWMMVLLVVAALGVGYGLGSLSRGDSGGAAGRADRGDVRLDSENPASSSSSDEGWAPLIDTLPIEQPAPGTGKIVGRVVDGNGDGLAGAVVIAQPVFQSAPQQTSAGQGRPKQESLVALVQRFAKLESERRAGTREAVTDVDGMYALTGLAGESYNVAAYKAGYRAVADRQRHGWGVKPDAELNFKARRVVPVKFEVTVSGGERPDRAIITYTKTVDGRSVERSAYWTAATPWVDLPPGAFTLRASLADGSAATSDTESIVVDPEDPPAPVSLRIVIKPSMRITVVPPPGFDGVRGYPVAMLFTGDKPPADDELRDARGHRTTGSDQEGRTLVRDLQPGRYLVGASMGYNGPIVVRKVVEVVDGQLDVELQVPAPDPSEYVLVRPLDPTGKALTGLNWIGAFMGKTRSGSTGAIAVYRADGVAYVRGSDRYRGLTGEHSFVATHDKYGTLRAVVDPASRAPVTMQFEEPAFVHVIVAGYRGSGREGRLSVALLQAGVRSRSSSQQPDVAGKVTFGPVQPGDYTLRLDVATVRHSSPEIATAQVSLQSGRQSASLAIPVLYELKMTWTGKGKPTFMLSKGANSRSFRSLIRREVDAKGVAIFRDLVAGEYTVRVANVSKNIEPRTVTVPSTTELTLP